MLIVYAVKLIQLKLMWENQFSSYRWLIRFQFIFERQDSSMICFQECQGKYLKSLSLLNDRN